MRLLARTVVTALATVAGLAVVPGPAEPPAAAAAASFPVEGRGWGHGIGLSQYGAQGAATRGLTYRQILSFYYPGTTVGTGSGAIRVLITDETRNQLVVGDRTGLSVRSPSTGTSYPLRRTGARFWRITASADNATSLVSAYVDGRWVLVRRIAGQAEFAASSLRLYLPEGSAVYRGRLRSAIAGGQRDVVNVVSLDVYVRGVVAQEMPALWKTHALRAQAVAARSYAVHERDTTDRGHFDVYDTTKSQVYGGASAETTQTNAAVTATAGEVRSYGGAAAFTQFSSSNGGWTVAGSKPYLRARQDPYDPVRTWTDSVTAAEVQRAWPAVGVVSAVAVVKQDGHGAWGGRAVTVRIKGSAKTIDVAGTDFRSYLGLKSTFFRFS